MNDYIGRYVKQFESGNSGSTTVGHSGIDWGLSCGSYQLTLKWGNCINFLHQYFKSNSSISENLRSRVSALYFNSTEYNAADWTYYPGAEYCSSPQDVSAVWLDCVDAVGLDQFFAYEHEYIQNTCYIPFIARVPQSIINLQQTSRAFQECFWSWSVFSGAGGAYNEFQQVMAKIGSIESATTEQFFNTIYDVRKISLQSVYGSTAIRYSVGVAGSEPETLRKLLTINGLGVSVINSPNTYDKKNTKTESDKSTIQGYVFQSRMSLPDKNSSAIKYYKNISDGGYNTAIRGSDITYTALPNCVGYVVGRFREIQNRDCNGMYAGNAHTFWANRNSISNASGNIPQLGAIMCWSGGGMGLGHVAIVESIKKINNYYEITISESGYPSILFETRTLNNSNGSWDMNWGGWYKFQGFIYNPAVPKDASNSKQINDNAPEESFNSSYDNSDSFYDVNEAVNIPDELLEYSIIQSSIRTYDGPENVKDSHSTSLLSYPTFVESPFTIVKIGGHTFGSYIKNSTNLPGVVNIEYPNYVKSITVNKINGQVNTYTINMVYQVEAGNDPNFLDKIFSKIGYGTIYISYGDWRCPSFVYAEEEAIITKVTTQVDFAQHKINYVINATSSSSALMGGVNYFPKVVKKPSTVIYEIFKNNSYGIKELFKGMNTTNFWQYVASDDEVVTINAKEGMDALSYINYLVSCMRPLGTNSDSPIKNATYYLSIHDDVNGQYFKVTKVSANQAILDTSDTYNIDVGYPDIKDTEHENFVTNFQVTSDNSWALLYDYNGQINKQNYVYKYDNDGNLTTEYSPNITTSSKYKSTTSTLKGWWTKVTQFPVEATLTIKGLLRPALLMTYVRINSYFYGQKHITSGLYVITKQQDTVNQSGYRTILTLVRVGGDYDYVTPEVQIIKKSADKADGIKIYHEDQTETGESLSSYLENVFSSLAGMFSSPISESEKYKDYVLKGSNNFVFGFSFFEEDGGNPIKYLYNAKDSNLKEREWEVAQVDMERGIAKIQVGIEGYNYFERLAREQDAGFISLQTMQLGPKDYEYLSIYVNITSLTPPNI